MPYPSVRPSDYNPLLRIRTAQAAPDRIDPGPSARSGRATPHRHLTLTTIESSELTEPREPSKIWGSWFYFSFADGSRPKGTQFLGACYVRGLTLEDALTRSHRLGINPGGEVKILGPIPAEAIEENVPVADRERLLSPELDEGWETWSD